jgi:hypothetical protein
MQSQINPRSGWVLVLLAGPSDCFEHAVEIVKKGIVTFLCPRPLDCSEVQTESIFSLD